MRILVTGHNGYIGPRMVPLLQAAGHEVHGLDADLFARCTFGPPPAAVPAVRKDIRDVTTGDLRGFGAVIHLAALSNDPLGDLDPALTYEINYEATVRLAEAAKTAGVRRFVFSSSCSTYGAAGDDFLDESADFNPVTPYGETKVQAEHALAGLADDGFSPTYLRNATAYGFSPRHRFDIVLNNLVAWAVTTGEVLLKSDGSPWRPLVHIEDISRAFLAVLEAPREAVHDEAFNVGRTDENYRIRDVAGIVAETVPGCRLAFAEGAGPDKRTYRVRCDKISQVLPHFQPQWDVRRGARELYEAYRRHGLQAETFEGPRYRRLAHIQQLMQEGLLDPSLRWTSEAFHVS